MSKLVVFIVAVNLILCIDSVLMYLVVVVGIYIIVLFGFMELEKLLFKNDWIIVVKFFIGKMVDILF